MKIITRSDVTFFVSAIGGILGIFVLLWKLLFSRMVTREDLLKELMSLREFLRSEFISRKEFEGRMGKKK
jgi:hypothetical protein